MTSDAIVSVLQRLPYYILESKTYDNHILFVKIERVDKREVWLDFQGDAPFRPEIPSPCKPVIPTEPLVLLSPQTQLLKSL